MDDDWDERYRTGDYTPRPHPSRLLVEHEPWLPSGRALDLATGTGRNALFLAGQGYEVDAVDVSGEALRRADRRAEDRGLAVNWIRCDLREGPLPDAEYDVINCSFFHTLDRLPDVKDRLAPGGVLLWEHYLRSSVALDRGPSDDRHRYGSNDLLRACLDLTVLEYSEAVHRFERGERAGMTGALVRLVARNSDGPAQSYPPAST